MPQRPSKHSSASPGTKPVSKRGATVAASADLESETMPLRIEDLVETLGDPRTPGVLVNILEASLRSQRTGMDMAERDLTADVALAELKRVPDLKAHLNDPKKREQALNDAKSIRNRIVAGDLPTFDLEFKKWVEAKR